MSELSKADKMRTIIRRELERSVVPNLHKAIYQNATYIKKLKQYPEFMPAMINELVEIQLPYYMKASDAAADAAYAFFMTEAGTEWCNMAGQFNDDLQRIFKPFVLDLARRLDALELN